MDILDLFRNIDEVWVGGQFATKLVLLKTIKRDIKTK